MMVFPFKPDFLAAASSLLHSLTVVPLTGGIASKGENGEAVYVLEWLPFSLETIDLAFGKCLRLISHICFQTIEITS